jgi:hypothetical protein
MWHAGFLNLPLGSLKTTVLEEMGKTENAD